MDIHWAGLVLQLYSDRRTLNHFSVTCSLPGSQGPRVTATGMHRLGFAHFLSEAISD